MEWARSEAAGCHKKLLIYYIIKRDLEPIAKGDASGIGEISMEKNGDTSQLTMKKFEDLHADFLEYFNLNDQEIAFISGLVRLDMLIQKADTNSELVS